MSRSLLATALLASSLACGASSGGSSWNVVRVPVGDSPQRGPGDAWVTVVEFLDFQCPYCRAEEPVLDGVVAGFGADVRVVFKHFPLPATIHPYAWQAAIAAECAHRQTRFWELHDLLLTTALDDATLRADAGQVPGLDVVAWEACLDAVATSAVVDADVALGTELGVPGTPAFVVNGRLLVGALEAPDLQDAIEGARATAVRSGVPRSQYYDVAVLGR